MLRCAGCTLKKVPWAKVGLGKTYYLKKDYDQARSVLLEVVKKYSFIPEASDWLAKTYEATGELKRAQSVLERAASISSKVVLRQQELARIATLNSDRETAQTAYLKAIKLGQHSIFKNSKCYTELARSQIESGNIKEAMGVLKSLKQEFGRSQEDQVQAMLLESHAFNQIGRTDKARQNIDKALRIFENINVKNNNELIMDAANACFIVGKHERAHEMTKEVVKNNIDNSRVLNEVTTVYQSHGLEDHVESHVKRFFN